MAGQRRDVSAADIQAALDQTNGNVVEAAKLLDIPRSTLSDKINRQKIGVVRTTVKGPNESAETKIESETSKRKITDQIILEGDVSEEVLRNPAKLLEDYGLTSSEWEVVKVDIAERDGAKGKVRSVAVSVVRKDELPPKPAFAGKPITIKPNKAKKPKREGELAVFVSDFHAPYHNEQLVSAFLQLLEEQQPEIVLMGGDLVDFPTLSRHPKKRPTTATAQECIDQGGRILADVRAAVPEAEITWLPGNHDEWLYSFLLKQSEELFSLTAYGDGTPVVSLENLFRLQDLDIELRGPGYPNSFYALTPHLLAHHGTAARKNSGSSVLGSMDNKSSFGEIVGHNHRMALVNKSSYELITNEETGEVETKVKTYAGAEAGCMCEIAGPKEFPSYDRMPDWANGFITISLETDNGKPTSKGGTRTGRYALDQATWQTDRLYWRGNLYFPSSKA